MIQYLRSKLTDIGAWFSSSRTKKMNTELDEAMLKLLQHIRHCVSKNTNIYFYESNPKESETFSRTYPHYCTYRQIIKTYLDEVGKNLLKKIKDYNGFFFFKKFY